jgi:hypothetical protein
MRFRTPFAALVLSVAAFAQTISVEQVRQFVRSAIERKQPDKQVAATLARMKLTEKLSDSAIEELQGEGAGPKTVAILKDMGTASQSLSAPPPPPPPKVYTPPPPPSYEDQQRILNAVREYALNYSKTLPDFICTQVTRRFWDPTGKESWRTGDTVTSKVTYFEQKEKYQTILVNGQMTDKAMDALGGTTSSGEFGSMLRGIFEAKSDAEFHWERWATLRGRRAHVYNYSVEQTRSDWGILDGDSKRSIVPAYRGFVYVDRDTNQVLKVTLEGVNIPADFPIQVAKDELDFDYVELTGQKFLLPMKAQVRLNRGQYLSKNDIEFRTYRKYSADAVISYDIDTSGPIDEKKTKEQPPKQ